MFFKPRRVGEPTSYGCRGCSWRSMSACSGEIQRKISTFAGYMRPVMTGERASILVGNVPAGDGVPVVIGHGARLGPDGGDIRRQLVGAVGVLRPGLLDGGQVHRAGAPALGVIGLPQHVVVEDLDLPDAAILHIGVFVDAAFPEIGRASCRERVCQYV